jgi:endonuclease/exonuclease/phosphatase (EEP) superfamily protein YafD
MEKRIRLVGLLEAFFYLTLIGTIAMIFSRFYWFLELFSHFCVQYIILLFFGTIFFAITKKWKQLALFTVALFLNMAYVVPYFVMPTEVKTQQTSPLNMFIFNVNKKNERREEIISYLKTANFDLILLLEVGQEWKKDLTELTDLYPHQKGQPRGDSFGIYFLSRKPVNMMEIFYLPSSQGVPAVIAEIEHQGQPFTLLGVHTLPPISPTYAAIRNTQIKALAKKAQEISTPVVIGGDFNITPWSPYFSDFLSETRLYDARKGYGIKATWPSAIPLLWIPIDYCLVSQNVKIHSYQVGKSQGSDHYPIHVAFSIPIAKNE